MRLEGRLTLLAGKKLTNVCVWLQIIYLLFHFISLRVNTLFAYAHETKTLVLRLVQ